MALNNKVKAMLVLLCLVMTTTALVAEAAGKGDNAAFDVCMKECVWDCKRDSKLIKIPPSECPQFCSGVCHSPHG